MPDDQDYADLARLLASPGSWSAADASHARWQLRNQEKAVAALRPKDVRRVAEMQQVVDDLQAAVSEYQQHPR